MKLVFRVNRLGFLCEGDSLTLRWVNSINGVHPSSQTDAILLDFSKAFDKVSHSRVLLKLKHYDVSNSTLSWVTNFLDGLTLRWVNSIKPSLFTRNTSFMSR